MKIVRYTEMAENRPEEWLLAGWGLLVDDLINPLNQAPYLSKFDDGAYAPEVIAPPRPLASVQLLAPVMPGKIACVGRNYAEHAAETGNEVPPEPLIFLKAPSAVIGPDEPVVYPQISQRVDHEGELAVVIGRRCRNVRKEEAARVIFGYTVANDVTARDLQTKDGQWSRAKGFDTFCPVGPWIDTAYDPAQRYVRCLVNGEVRQNSHTGLMIYSIPQIIAHISRFMTLEPGDLILTGTPSGVAPRQPGDVMTVEVQGLGSLSNPVVPEDSF